MDRVAQGPPAREWSGKAELLSVNDGSVECDPGHYLRGDEVSRGAAHRPDALVGHVPVRLDVVDERACERPFLTRELEPGVAGLVDRVDDLAVGVELKLPDRLVPDPYRLRALVAREPWELELGQ